MRRVRRKKRYSVTSINEMTPWDYNEKKLQIKQCCPFPVFSTCHESTLFLNSNQRFVWSSIRAYLSPWCPVLSRVGRRGYQTGDLSIWLRVNPQRHKHTHTSERRAERTTSGYGTCQVLNQKKKKAPEKRSKVFIDGRYSGVSRRNPDVKDRIGKEEDKKEEQNENRSPRGQWKASRER